MPLEIAQEMQQSRGRLSLPIDSLSDCIVSISDLLQQAEEAEQLQKVTPLRIYSIIKLNIHFFQPKYSLRSKMLMEIQISGRVYLKRGSMVAYRGDLKFERGSSSKSFGMKLVKMATGEGPSMMKVTGEGRIFVADDCKKICILKLSNEKVIVNGSDILAFDDNAMDDKSNGKSKFHHSRWCIFC